MQEFLKASDWNEVLGRAGVLVVNAGQEREQRRRYVSEDSDLVGAEVRARFASGDAGPWGGGSAGQAKIPGVAAPAGAHEEDRGALAGVQCRDDGGVGARQIRGVVGLDVTDSVGQVGSSAQWPIDKQQFGFIVGSLVFGCEGDLQLGE